MEPEWSFALAFTESREVICPRPSQEYHIFQVTQKNMIGFLSYSDGCNDDPNKIVWSALAWDPTTSLTDIMQDYGRFFIGEGLGSQFAQGLLALEMNWKAPLDSNEMIPVTLKQFQDMEAKSPILTRTNWRFLTGVYRAYYDAYIRRKYIFEKQLEEETLSVLSQYTQLGPAQAIARASQIIQRPFTDPEAQSWKSRIFAIGEALFQLISFQLSVPLYGACGSNRGATLDTIDIPMNNIKWLVQTFNNISNQSPDQQIQAIQTILNWKNPKPGGFYDDLGVTNEEPHLLPG